MKRDNRWLERQRKDPFVKQAHKAGYRSRAAFKLEQIDKRDHLFRPGQVVVDLGAAPGSWSQYASGKVGKHGLIIAVDMLDMVPFDQVSFIHGDFTDEAVYHACLEALGDRQADLVISDLAPNLTGIRDTDQARSLSLAELVLEFCERALRPGGDLLMKLFEGAGTDLFRRELGEQFQRVIIRKPDASRDSSREFYILGRGYKV